MPRHRHSIPAKQPPIFSHIKIVFVARGHIDLTEEDSLYLESYLKLTIKRFVKKFPNKLINIVSTVRVTRDSFIPNLPLCKYAYITVENDIEPFGLHNLTKEWLYDRFEIDSNKVLLKNIPKVFSVTFPYNNDINTEDLFNSKLQRHLASASCNEYNSEQYL